MRTFTIIFASLLALVQFAMAIPPACLLAALGKQTNPTDLATVCAGMNMNNNITAVCASGSVSAAYSAYSATCSAAGIQVAALPTASTNSTGTATGSSTTATGSSGSTTSSSPSSTNTKQSAAAGTSPQPLFFAISGLLATTLASVILL